MNWEQISKFVTTIGLPAAFACVLLWFVITTIHKAIDKAIDKQIQMERRIEECCCSKK